MNALQQRQVTLQALGHSEWDLLVVGGGITGAGVCREAARRGWRVALVEQHDFAWGTSSRSSKLVHGGLRYLRQGQFGLTLESVRERQHLMQQAPELIEPQSFVLAHAAGRKPGRYLMSLGLTIYDRMAGRASHAYADREAAAWLVPGWEPAGMTGATLYRDAKTDDARLVQRVLAEAQRDGALALNYLRAEGLLRDDGQVRGLELRDAESGAAHSVRARCVINATGVWTDGLRAGLGARPMMRPLRGSHLVVPHWRLPLAQSVSLMHPRDGRPVFFYPWEGATLIGTTDLDHGGDLSQEPSITPAEVQYLLEAVNDQFPALGIDAADVMSCYAGVRPVVDDGSGKPSEAARDHVVINESGLVTVCGGKLTTFRTMAQQALALAAPVVGKPFHRDEVAVFAPASTLDARLDRALRHRLAARWGFDAARLAALAQPEELECVGGTTTLWLEMRVAAASEAVVHLDDLLLRRTRLGLLTAGGGLEHAPRLRAVCVGALGWTDARWDDELTRYRRLLETHYRLPDQGASP